MGVIVFNFPSTVPEVLAIKELLSLASLFADLRAAVARIGEQLPYLLLTDSSENYVRDTLAFQLSTKYHRVAREFPIQYDGRARKADIALLGPSGPRAVIELKQLYLKGLRQEGHAHVRNIVADVAHRESVCAEVYGVVLPRRVPTGYPLPWADGSRYSFVAANERFAADGIARLHAVLTGLPAFAAVHPANWQEARLLPLAFFRNIGRRLGAASGGLWESGLGTT